MGIVHALYTLGTRLWGYGVTCSFFSVEKKEPKKSRFCLSPANHLSSDVFRELYTGSYTTFLRCLARPEPAAFLLSMFMAHASYNLYSFRDSANGLFLFRQVSPAPCSPPLGGSIADSAVRFTPAVKYGGRENLPSGRETRCMSSHPCRAHHILKWARKVQSVLKFLYKYLPRSESNKSQSLTSDWQSHLTTYN